MLCPGTSLHPRHGLIAVLVRNRLRTHDHEMPGCTRRNRMRDGRANRDSYRRTRRPDEHADECSSPGNGQENEDSQQETYLPSAVSPREPWIEHEVTPQPLRLRENAYRRLRIGKFHASDVSSTSSVPGPAEAKALTSSGKSSSGRNQCRSAVAGAKTVAATADNTCHAWTTVAYRPQHADHVGRSWTMCPLLRIRRLGVRVPPSAPSSARSHHVDGSVAIAAIP